MPESKKRLIVLFDGTWNDPQDRTNVYRLACSIKDRDGDIRQRFFYDPGVGTSPLTRMIGGVSGFGLSRNLLQGYKWLAKRYSEGDEIWVFGFSRGAYTARSLVGMIRKCGLLHIATPDLLTAAEKIYRNKAAAPDGDTCRRFRAQYSREAKIHMIGVWDTVGALGVPGTVVSERGYYSWHDTRLSKIVERAFHAVALDEHRAVYDAVLWTNKNGMKKPEQKEVEQRWFIGAHANVGGGYGDDPLADIPLAWMQEKAMAAGLKLTPCTPAPDACLARLSDSFKTFLFGMYAGYRKLFHSGEGRYYRRFDSDTEGNLAVNVTVDPSVWDRFSRSDPEYRPRTLIRAGLTPPQQAASQNTAICGTEPIQKAV